MPDRDARRPHELAAAQVRRFSARGRRAVETAWNTNWAEWIGAHRTRAFRALRRVRRRLRLLERTGHNILKRLASKHPRTARLVHWVRYHTHHGEADHGDDRYPRKWWFRSVRFILRGWWLIFVAIFGIVGSNLIVLAYNVVLLQGKPLRASAVLRALWVDHILSGLHHGPMPTLLVSCGLVGITWVGRWAARDCKHELQVVERRKERERNRQQIEERMRQNAAEHSVLVARWQAFLDRMERRFGPLDDLLDGDGLPAQDAPSPDTPEEPP